MTSDEVIRDWWNVLTTADKFAHVITMLNGLDDVAWRSWAVEWDELSAANQLMLGRYYDEYRLRE